MATQPICFHETYNRGVVVNMVLIMLDSCFRKTLRIDSISRFPVYFRYWSFIIFDSFVEIVVEKTTD